MPKHGITHHEVRIKKAAERLIGTLNQTYLSPTIIDVLRNSVMADHDPRLKISLQTDRPQHIQYELTVIPYDSPHAETFPLKLQLVVLTPQNNDLLWRKLYTAINENTVLNRRYVVSGLHLDIDTGAITFCI